MSNGARVVIVVAVVLVAGGVLALKKRDANRAAAPPRVDDDPVVERGPTAEVPPTTQPGVSLPRLVDHGFLALKNRDEGGDSASHPTEANPAVDRGTATEVSAANQSQAPLPRLVDLGAGKCIPCKQMAPILENLKKDYAGRMKVEFIDVWENPKAGEEYQIRMIPTQIFYDASGKELFRHEGFFSREDILGKWKELGVDVEAKPASS